ncbi:hybrid sensor histidine kinase/response regulator [Oscillatoriales cyanobacterium USR001]|nr:hybrid sensor histidine kinase/response regulator [Oscillatoriales cyanobacterium USR001]
MKIEQIYAKSGKILVIDDSPSNLKILMSLLSEQGYTVRPMPSGKLALQGIHLDYPDLILLDIEMPDMDGYQVCQCLKEDERTQDIPVIFVSAYEDVLDKVKAFELGGIDYITKPFQPEEILVRVQNHLVLYKLKKGLQEKTEYQDKKLAEQNALLQEMNQQLSAANQELSRNLAELEKAQLQVVQAEKMSTLGQLVGGVAHEINNPVSFLMGNIQPAKNYVVSLFSLLDLYAEAFPHPGEKIENEIREIELDFLREDLPMLLDSMNVGVERIKNISTSLRTFSRMDREYKVPFNLHEGIDSTLLILKHRLKSNQSRPEIGIVKNYGDLPEINCFPGQLNQVFMNLLANAIDALEERSLGHTFAEIANLKNRICLDTGLWQYAPSQDLESADRSQEQWVFVKISDNGTGMTEEVKQRFFEQGFTTKGVGKGTGLGMAIARQIVEEKHGGKITCHSELGKGTEFTVLLPI